MVSEKDLSKVSVRFPSKNASLNNQLPSEVGRSCLMLEFFLVGNSLAAVCDMNVPSNASLDSQGEKSSPTPRTTEYLSTTELNPIPTARKIIDMWKKNHNAFGILYSWFLSKVSSQLELFPDAEFRVAYDEAMKYGAKVVLGDSSDSTVKLEWGVMYKIALGAAKGLQYLHEGCQRRINQRCIKAVDIFLSEEFEAKIHDFDIAKWLPESWTHHTISQFEGTFGYNATCICRHGALFVC